MPNQVSKLKQYNNYFWLPTIGTETSCDDGVL